MSSDVAVLTEESDVRQTLGLVQGGEHQAHVGQVRGPLEVVGLHLVCSSWLLHVWPSVDCKGLAV